MMEVRALSVDHLSTARYVVGTAFARGAKDHYSNADMEAFAEFVRSPHYADVLLGNSCIRCSAATALERG
jgi:hypothetical protein